MFSLLKLPPPGCAGDYVIFSHMSIQLPLSFCLCPSRPQPFFHIHICNKIFRLSVHLFCVSVSKSLVCASRFLIYPNAIKKKRCALPPNPPPAFFKLPTSDFSHPFMQPPLSIQKLSLSLFLSVFVKLCLSTTPPSPVQSVHLAFSSIGTPWGGGVAPSPQPPSSLF